MPGMNAEVVVRIAGRASVVVVPSGAVVTPGDASAAASLVGATRSMASTPATAVGAVAAEGRMGVVFVQGATGVESRNVVLGLSDWDYTEIISGLADGEKVILISVARMREQQDRDTPSLFGGRGGDDDDDAPAQRGS
jgi:HlyD family secretion protein